MALQLFPVTLVSVPASPSRSCAFFGPFRINSLHTLLHHVISEVLCNLSIPHSLRKIGGCVRPPPGSGLRKAGRFCTILAQSKSCRINTYKSVSKQETLTVFRINTYEKHRGEG